MISTRLQYLAERLASNAERNEAFSARECHTMAQQLLFFAEQVERMERSVLAPQDDVLAAMTEDAA